MSRKIFLTESQFNRLMEREMLNESFNSILEKVAAGVLTVYMACAMIRGCQSYDEFTKQRMIQQVEQVANENQKMDLAAEAMEIDEQGYNGMLSKDWKKISDSTQVTVYNLEASQCNNDLKHTASMFNLDMEKPETHKIVALERTFMKRHGIKFGDLIMIKGTYKGKQDGIYQVQDLMNKRFAGQDKVDILVDYNTRYGGTAKGQYATVYLLVNNENKADYMKDMAPQSL